MNFYRAICHQIRSSAKDTVFAALWQTRAQRLGRRAENAAHRFLTSAGYHIWERNWRCRIGEIDLICYRGNTLIIVEVKSLTHHSGGRFTPFDHLDRRKILRLRRLATRFWRQNRVELKARRLRNWRIDALSVVVGFWGNILSLKHLKNITTAPMAYHA